MVSPRDVKAPQKMAPSG